MTKKPVLVVLAAGMGSRYGGLKQIDPVGCCGEAILDYSLYDAHRAGFETAVIIIKEAIRNDFMATVGKRLEKCPMEIRYAYQELDKVPNGFAVPHDRVKPWGTCHAVMCAKDAIGGAPFAVINADDYYGVSAYRVIYDELMQQSDSDKFHYCMVGYLLKNTVTEHGSVTRAICAHDSSGYLTSICERTRIEMFEDGIRYTEDGQTWESLPDDTVVSMNLWGFGSSFLSELEQRFPVFLEAALVNNPVKAEYVLPTAIEEMLAEQKVVVKVLQSADRWFGVTYAADKPGVVKALKEKTDAGLYPSGLWK